MSADGRSLHAVLLSGGGGTRLWPVSTDVRPKQFLRMFGELSLFQLTLERVRDCGIADIHVVTNAAYAHDVESQASERGIPVSLIVEPIRRDSAPAIAAGLAALQAEFGPEAIAVVLPCDHLIPDHGAFRQALSDAIMAARSGFLVTFGITPTAPSTEYGYIQQGERLGVAEDVFRASAFREKPDIGTANVYFASGGYHWNSGMFVFQVSDFAREANIYMPEIWYAALKAVRLGEKSEHHLRLDEEAFSKAQRISIDYALFEKSASVALLPRHFDWSDVGSWNAVHAALPHDADGNAIWGDASIHDSQNTLAFGDGVRVIALGIKDLVVIASANGIYVAPMSRASEIKKFL